MIECRKCGETKDDSLFGTVKGKPRRWCKACHAADNLHRYHTNQQTRERHRAAGRKASLKLRYGLTEDAVKAMMEAVGNCCEICDKPLLFTSNNTADSAHIDHCHDTGNIRGILCSRCNSGLGFFDDKEYLVKKALTYLEGK